MPVSTTITLAIKAASTLPSTRDEWPANRPLARCRPRRPGDSPPSEPRRTGLITDEDARSRRFYSAAWRLLTVARRRTPVPVFARLRGGIEVSCATGYPNPRVGVRHAGGRAQGT